MRKYHIIWITVAVLFCSCSTRALHEAQRVVAEADSLWHEGQLYNDSNALAQAYNTLDSWSRSHADEYAHACYHYGKLLREKEDPVTAMQVFIDATHSHTHDYHILGRIYSNIGDICHLAREFELSRIMFEESANSFLKGGDTLLYYYGINNIAFELAELGRKGDALSFLADIESHCTDSNILLIVKETKAEMYRIMQQYDSALYYINCIESLGFVSSTTNLIKAQSLYRIGKSDSAIVYANLVLSDSNASYQDQFNALYIVSHVDSTLSTEAIRDLDSQREDIRFYQYEPEKEALISAINLLRQNRNPNVDYQWLLATAATLLACSSIIVLYVYRKRKKHGLLVQKIDDLTITLHQHEHVIQEHNEYTNNLTAQLEQNSIALVQSKEFPDNIHWKDFDSLSKLINDNFGMLVIKLRNMYHLSEKETRLCVLVLIGISSGKQLAEMLFYSESGIRNYKNRIAKKLGTNSVELRDFLINLAINKSSKLLHH